MEKILSVLFSLYHYTFDTIFFIMYDSVVRSTWKPYLSKRKHD